MKTNTALLILLAAGAYVAFAETKPATEPKSPPATQNAPAKKPRIEVCFVLDTTGSMSDLLEGAKQKIWAIANDMISAKPTPELKVGLVGYRDKGDEYVVKPFALTDDIDAMYGHLREFAAGGGGDTPESVNEALDEAINKMKWSDDRDVLKIVFLVGDAPPHMDYANGPKYPDLCRAAAKKDLIINTVQCGGIARDRGYLEGNRQALRRQLRRDRAVRKHGRGLDADGRKAGRTKQAHRRDLDSLRRRGPPREVASKQAVAESAPAPAAADRLSYNARTNKSVQGAGELLDALARKDLKLEAFSKRICLPNCRN